MKKKFWPFAIYKWSDWPGPKERCSNLYEARLTKCLHWKDAYWCCRDDIEYIDKNEERFYNRRKGAYHFLALMSVVAILVVLTIIIFCKEWFIPFTVIGMLALFEFTAVYLIVRRIYYHGVWFDLCHANNRIDALTQVWPDIVNIVCNDMDNGSTDLPPEPRKTPGITDEIETISMLLERGS